jgi:hypothetical protein
MYIYTKGRNNDAQSGLKLKQIGSGGLGVYQNNADIVGHAEKKQFKQK